MRRTISTTEATLQTATIEVRVITLSSKQMTLSVFRQLQEEDPLDRDTFALRGVLWGQVNYFWGHCQPDHLHVVWQKEQELRRACVQDWHGSDQLELLKRQAADLVRVDLLFQCLAGWEPSWDISWHGGGTTVRCTREGRKFAVDLSTGICQVFPTKGKGSRWALPETPEQKAERIQTAREKIRAEIAQVTDCVDQEEFYRTVLVPHFRALAALEEAWRARYEELAALPQLFIAV
jgi:hypothetical protein